MADTYGAMGDVYGAVGGNYGTLNTAVALPITWRNFDGGATARSMDEGSAS